MDDCCKNFEIKTRILIRNIKDYFNNNDNIIETKDKATSPIIPDKKFDDEIADDFSHDFEIIVMDEENALLH